MSETAKSVFDPNKPLFGGLRMQLKEWEQLMRTCLMLDKEFKMADARLAFAWSRLAVSNEFNDMHVTLSINDFLEAVSRVAVTKSMPSKSQLKSAGMGTDPCKYMTQWRAGQADWTRSLEMRPYSFDYSTIGQAMEAKTAEDSKNDEDGPKKEETEEKQQAFEDNGSALDKRLGILLQYMEQALERHMSPDEYATFKDTLSRLKRQSESTQRTQQSAGQTSGRKVSILA
jgi:hypothetical protein